MDAFAEGSGPLAMYDADTGKMCHVGVIQILVQLGDGLVHGLSEKIEFHGHGCRLGHPDLAGSGAGQVRCLDGHFVDQLQIVYIYLGVQDAHAHLQEASGVGDCHDGSLQVHRLHEDAVSGTQFLRIRCFALLSDHGDIRIRLAFADLLIQSIHLLTKPGPFTFHLAGCIGICAVLIVVADRFIRISFGLTQDLRSFLAGFGQDLLPGLLQIAAPALQ